MSRRMTRVERAALAHWQGQVHLHPLTCRVNSSHRPLSETFPEGALGCPDCDYRQDDFPQVVIDHFLNEARHALEEES